MKTAPIAAAVAAAFALSGTAHADDARPTTPDDVRATLYPGAGGELFWSRSSDDRGVRGYAVAVNGEEVGTFDALSYYDPSLRSGTPYTFTVTAIDTAGQRSGAASASLGDESNPGGPGIGPTAPAGLNATVYSSSAAELFWTRAQMPGLRYEIRRDGQVVATTDGTSHFANGLSAGADYAFEVIAIDGAGLRSAPSAVSLRTAGGGAANPGTPIAPDSNPEIRPEDLSITVYSTTAAELFWTPAGSVRPVITRNEIRRDGVLIATLEGEFLGSYFDATREPGESYTYEVRATSSAGSASATVSDAGFEGAGPSAPLPVTGTDLPADVSATLATAFELVNGVAIEKVAATMQRLNDPSIYRADTGLGFELLSFGPDAASEGFLVRESYTCPRGGTIDLLRAAEDGDSLVTFQVFEAEECGVGPVVLSGFAQVSQPIDPDSTDEPLQLGVRDFALDDSRDLSTVTISDAVLSEFPPEPTLNGYFATELSVERPEGSYEAQSFSTTGSDAGNALPDGTLGLVARGFQVGGLLPGQANVAQRGPFVFRDGRDAGRPTEGRLSIATDGREYLVDAFDGDPSTFTLVVTEDGATTSYTVPFSDAFRVDAPDSEGIDVGF